MAEAKRRAEEAEVREEASARAAAIKASEEGRQHERFARRELNVPDDSDADVARLVQLGFSREDIRLAAFEPELGPRSGMSDASRLLRGIALGLVERTAGGKLSVRPIVLARDAGSDRIRPNAHLDGS